MLKDYLLENKFLYPTTHFKKRQGQSWTHKSPNASIAQICYIIINRKRKNSAKNCIAYNSFISVTSDHRIISANIRLSLKLGSHRT